MRTDKTKKYYKPSKSKTFKIIENQNDIDLRDKKKRRKNERIKKKSRIANRKKK